MIVTLTGASGVGKTSIVRELLKDLCHIGGKVMISYTTRAPRESDLPGEYCYVSDAEFNVIRAEGRFLWTVEVHGARHGTLTGSVLGALFASASDSVSSSVSAPRVVSFMLLVPDVLERLWEFGRGIVPNPAITSFYVLAPPPEVLRARLLMRGDGAAAIDGRLRDCARWDEEAKTSRIPYIFITNDGPIARAVVAIRRRIIGI